MPGIVGIMKGAKAAFAQTPDGLKAGLYKNADGVIKAKPGYAHSLIDDEVTLNTGRWAMIQRNPGTTAAVAGTGGVLYVNS